jgi:D-glycero-D-manno-heptose 1,7-bisphosphate phosphatase
MKVGVFIERDGVLNKVRLEGQHQVTPLTAIEFEVNPDALPLLRKLKAAGLVLIATTNQPGLSHGQLCRRELDRMHDMLRRALPLDDIFVCPHAEADRCPCRKPKPGLLIEAKFKWHLDLERSFVISDKWYDAEAARAAGCTSLILKSPWVGSVHHHDFLLPNLPTAVDKLLQLHLSGAVIA